MAGKNYSISFDMGSQFDLKSEIYGQVTPLLSQAVKAIAQQTASDWQQAVYKAKLWQGEKDKYAQSISWSMTGQFSAVVEATYQYAEDIESGRPARDLKTMLSYSMKVRQSKSGTRYLSIPFRHNTPGNDALGKAMPDNVFAMAKDMTPSVITGIQSRKSGTGAFNIHTKAHFMVPQNVYKWGDRLPSGLAQKIKPQHHSDPYAGMVKFNTTTPGGAKSSTYLTFRTMSEKSSGWIVPAQPGQKIAEGVRDAMQPKAENAFSKAISMTLAKMKG